MKYEIPEMVVITFEEEDIVRTSGPIETEEDEF